MPSSLAVPWFGALKWQKVDGSCLMEADCGADGNCLFACMAVWMNFAEGRPRYHAGEMRCLAASALDSATAEFLCAEAQSYGEMRKTTEDLEELKQQLCHPKIWGNNTLLLLWLRAVERLHGVALEAIVLVDSESRFARVADSSASSAASRYAICLHCIDERHYRLLGFYCPVARRIRVIFDLDRRVFV